MKFGKSLKKQKVPEWAEAYVDYNALKRVLQEIRSFKENHPLLNRVRSTQQRLVELREVSGLDLHDNDGHFVNEGDTENQVIAVHVVQQGNLRERYKTKLLVSVDEADESERLFFRRLDDELNKTNNFYKDKVEEVKREASLLKRQMDVLIALRVKVKNPEFDGSLKGLSAEMSSSVPSKITSPDRTESARVNLSCQRHESDSQSECDEAAYLDILENVKISNTCDSPISTIRGVLKDSKENDLRYNEEELKKVEERLKSVFVEFYQKLGLLKHYSFLNLSAFSKILKKYEKVTSRSVARSYMNIVDNSYIGSSDEVICLMERVESVFVKSFLNSNRREGMKLLRPKLKKEKHRVTFFSGFFSGCSLALLIAVYLLIGDGQLIRSRTATLYMDTIYPLYSFYAYIFLHMLMYAANIYFWRRYRINYPFIFGFKQGTELGYREVFLLSSGLAVIALGTLLIHLHIKMDSGTEHNKTYIELLPLGLVIVVLAIIFCPFHLIYRSSRYFFITSVFHCICAPLYKVTLPDFFLADQLTSQVQAIRSFEYYICFYLGRKFSERQNQYCSSYDVYNVFYFIVAVIPYWFRCLQCVRRLVEEKDHAHGYNGLKYFLTIVAVVIRTAFELRKNLVWKVLAILSSAVATLMNTYWDLVVDWGLLQRKSKNMFLRDKLLISHRSVYFVAMVLNIILRFAWLQLVLSLDVHSLRGKTISTVFSCLEILRRGMWNFFRLENEHLNNVGRYRAFKSVPLPFTYYEEEEDDEIDKDD